MATWEEVRDRLRRQYALDVDDSDEIALTVSRRENNEQRSQRIMMRRYQSWGREMVEFRSAFGELGEYDPTTLLADNLNLPLGSIALHGKYLVLVQRACLDDLQIEGVLFYVTRLSILADILEGRRGGDRF